MKLLNKISCAILMIPFCAHAGIVDMLTANSTELKAIPGQLDATVAQLKKTYDDIAKSIADIAANKGSIGSQKQQINAGINQLDIKKYVQQYLGMSATAAQTFVDTITYTLGYGPVIGELTGALNITSKTIDTIDLMLTNIKNSLEAARAPLNYNAPNEIYQLIDGAKSHFTNAAAKLDQLANMIRAVQGGQ